MQQAKNIVEQEWYRQTGEVLRKTQGILRVKCRMTGDVGRGDAFGDVKQSSPKEDLS